MFKKQVGYLQQKDTFYGKTGTKKHDYIRRCFFLSLHTGCVSYANIVLLAAWVLNQEEFILAFSMHHLIRIVLERENNKNDMQ